MSVPVDPALRGIQLLQRPDRNKGTAFTDAERDALGLRGLLPPRIHTQAEQVERVLENVRRKPSDLERYVFLAGLQDRNETLYYRLIVDHVEEMLPVIYTPTVGRACQEFGHIYRRPRGLYVTAEDRGRVAEVLAHWPHEARVMVVTDGERILGLGDLGTNGMGIPIGKLALYTACGGIRPEDCLPVTLDVGTENQSLLDDPIYLGLRRRRIRGDAYDALVEELVAAATDRFPGLLVQLEDFANANAFRLLERYRDRVCLFNDDIQGTGATGLAGLYAALRITGGALADQRVLFVGAGEAAIGIGETVVAALVDEGLSEADARRRCWYVDSRGLVVAGREGLNDHKRPFAHASEGADDLLTAVRRVRPTAILGVSGQPGVVTAAVLEELAAQVDRPIVFALSNPTSKSECTAEEAYRHTGGRAIFASGSPFEPVKLDGRTHVPGQGNNAYIFPGVGLGVVATGATRVPDEMFLAAARTLASHVTDSELAEGRVYPALPRIREVSKAIAVAVAGVAERRGLATVSGPVDGDTIDSLFYEPTYDGD